MAVGPAPGRATAVRVPRHPDTHDARRALTEPIRARRASKGHSFPRLRVGLVCGRRRQAMNLRITLVLIALGITGGAVWWVGPRLPRQLAPAPEEAPPD